MTDLIPEFLIPWSQMTHTDESKPSVPAGVLSPDLLSTNMDFCTSAVLLFYSISNFT